MKKIAVTKPWGKREVLAMLGGIGNESFYEGVGITPLGKEPEAEISMMLASGAGGADLDEFWEESIKIQFPLPVIEEESIRIPMPALE